MFCKCHSTGDHRTCGHIFCQHPMPMLNCLQRKRPLIHMIKLHFRKKVLVLVHHGDHSRHGQDGVSLLQDIARTWGDVPDVLQRSGSWQLHEGHPSIRKSLVLNEASDMPPMFQLKIERRVWCVLMGSEDASWHVDWPEVCQWEMVA